MEIESFSGNKREIFHATNGLRYIDESERGERRESDDTANAKRSKLTYSSHAPSYRWHRSQKQQAPSNACVLFGRVKNVFDSICDKKDGIGRQRATRRSQYASILALT